MLLRAIALLWAALTLALAFAPLAQAQAVHQYTNTVDSAVDAIDDTQTPCSAPMKRTFTVAESYTIADVNIGVLMAHTYRQDMIFTLVSPTGTRVVVFNRAGGSNNNFNLLLDDEATTAVTSYTGASAATASTVVPPYTSTYKPSAALSAFDGANANGTWTLEMCDAAAIDSGTFFQADLIITQNYADLSLAKTVSNATPATGASISYTLSVTNAATSTSTATGVTVLDALPVGVTYSSASGTGTYNSTTGVWSVGSVAPGATSSITLTVVVMASAATTVTNNAEITASSIVDYDSTVNNGVTTEDDYATRSFTVSGTRTAGTLPTLSCSAGTKVLDWDSLSWTAGATSGSLAVSGVGNVNLAMTNPGSWVTNATYGGTSPTRQKIATGGIATAQFSLMEMFDVATTSDAVTTTITLPTAVPGAQFTLFDVDYTAAQFADKVTVTGSYNGVAVTPTLTNGIANYVIGNSAYGDAASTDTQANGNVGVTFSSAVDTITITVGNHSLAPANPLTQYVTIHDITFCTPQATLTVAKTSSVVSDPIHGTTGAFQIPGATLQYCILISNAGTATVTTVAAVDILPTKESYVVGTMKSGTTCAGAATAEDDNNTGADESDPFGASITGSTITGIAASIGPSTAMALVFNTKIN
jgi:uncharacterized repeat protein (TIGR01451 family)